MAGVKTSVWLTEEQHASWKATGVPLSVIIQRGLADSGDKKARLDLAMARLTEVLVLLQGGWTMVPPKESTY